VVIAIVGEDRASGHNAFKDTIGTFIKDNPSMDIRVIIDYLRIEAHSDPNGTILKLNDQLVAESDWDKIALVVVHILDLQDAIQVALMV